MFSLQKTYQLPYQWEKVRKKPVTVRIAFPTNHLVSAYNHLRSHERVDLVLLLALKTNKACIWTFVFSI